MNKSKIINDPVYGFVRIPYEVIFDLVEHPWFQRLRRIQQIGLGQYVYPGAVHTRFQHALGAVHLMRRALEVLASKGHEITSKEAEAATVAILLHDIGHGPFSHALEQTIVPGVHHEELSVKFIDALNSPSQMNGRLSLAREIFTGKYHKEFLHQLVSSQLDVDRLDYLTRDTYYTGVHEGVIGWNRIIDMMDVHDGKLVVEAKGIYSIEKFIIARRIMYWQVYLHKTVLCAEQMLIKALERALYLAKSGEALIASPALNYFLREMKFEDHQKASFLEKYAALDDHDIWSALKAWQYHEDKVLSLLCKSIVDRKLFHIDMQNEAPERDKVAALREAIAIHFNLQESEVDYLLLNDSTSKSAYSAKTSRINIRFKDGRVMDVTEASDQLNLTLLSDPVIKYYICYPKEIKAVLDL